MDEETIPFLQRAIGYSLTGLTVEHCFFLLFGLGRNGKSTFLSIIQYILGDYAMQTDWQSFAVAKNGGVQIRNDIARLHAARFVAAIESEKNVRLAESLIKALTGGDRITARFLYQESFEFEPQLKLWLATNHKPKVIGTDEAIWSRIKLIPFNVTVPPEKRDRHLSDKLKLEASGILNWALEGLRMYQQDGLRESKAVSDATELYRENSDVIQHFIDAKCVLARDGEIRASDLYGAYKFWVGASGEYQMNERDFGMTLEERGFKRARISARKDKPGGVYWHGIQLNQEAQAQSDTSVVLSGAQEPEELPF
jgi:putative DNA primase/helicase